MIEQTDFAAVMFVSFVLGGIIAWAIMFLVQHRLPGEMRGLRTDSFFRALVSAIRDSTAPSHRFAWVYLWSFAVFLIMLCLALMTWQFIDFATKA